MRAVERLAKAGNAFYLFGKVWKSGGIRWMGLLACWLLSALWGTAGKRGLHLFTLHQYVVQLNELRVSLGLPPLKVNLELCEAAQTQANEILIMQACSHVDRQGRRADARALQAGYRFMMLAENLAAGQPSWERAIEGWLNSPPHRMAMLAPDYREVGVGSAWTNTGRYTTAWAQVLGTRRGVYPLIINLDAPWTENPSVRLYVHGARRATAMRLSNDGRNWSEWRTPQEWVDWELPHEPGEHTVYVQLIIRGRVYETSDSILLR